MSVYTSILEWFDYHQIAFYENFVPFYACSMGCHLLNLANDRREFYFEQGKLANTRLHIIFCAPPGFMKTTLLGSFLMGPTSILENCEEVETTLEGMCTEAAFTGTIKVLDGVVQEIPGAAQIHSNAIVGIDEFSAISNAMKMEHSLNLDNALLTALDSGYVLKRLSMGELKYKTNLTLWSGSQPARYDLTSGLARRFAFMYFVPNRKQIEVIKMARRSGKNVEPNLGLLMGIRRKIKEMKERLAKVQEIDFHPSLNHALDELNVPHFEETLYEKIALGYAVTNAKYEKVLTVKMDETLKKIFLNEREWRIEIKKGAEISAALMVCRDCKGMTREQVRERMADYGIPYHKAENQLQILTKMKMIKFIKPHGGPNSKYAKEVLLVD